MVMLKGLFTRLGLSRRRKYPTIRIAREEVKNLLFGQQHLGTQDFFQDRLGQYHTVPLTSVPHFEFLDGWLRKPFAPDNPYLQYLEASWSYHYKDGRNTPQRREARVQRFANHLEYLSGKPDIPPIRVCRRPDGRLLIVDGNHRASIACKLGRDLEAELIPLEDHLANVTAVPGEFYGTKRLAKPYQSIYYQGRQLLAGRRTDVLDRISRIVELDLRDKRVLDLGCNLGMSCYLAAEKGAQVTGVEGSPSITTAAIRLNSVFAAPCRFIQHDLSQDLTIDKFDTVFCFSVIHHVKDKAALVRTLDRAIGRVLYFEGHAETSLNDYTGVLSKDRFSQIELLGYTGDGIHTTSNSRPLWRCEI